jgi:hypothetical protein
MARMNFQHDPVRLTDDPQQTQPELAAAIRGLRGEHGTADAVHALEQRLLATLGADALDAASALDASTSASSLRIVARTMLTLAGLAALFSLPSADSRQAELRRGPAETVLPAVVETRATALPAQAPAESAPVVPPTAATPIVAGAGHLPIATVATPAGVAGTSHVLPQSRRGLPREAAVPAAIARPAPQDPAGELDLLRRAHAALRRHDSNSALELVDQHAHDYPQGVFAQEREVLAVQALLKKQCRPEAIARAQQFIGRFADSAYAFRMRGLIEQTPRPAPGVLVSDANPDLTPKP